MTENIGKNFLDGAANLTLRAGAAVLSYINNHHTETLIAVGSASAAFVSPIGLAPLLFFTGVKIASLTNDGTAFACGVGGAIFTPFALMMPPNVSNGAQIDAYNQVLKGQIVEGVSCTGTASADHYSLWWKSTHESAIVTAEVKNVVVDRGGTYFSVAYSDGTLQKYHIPNRPAAPPSYDKGVREILPPV